MSCSRDTGVKLIPTAVGATCWIKVQIYGLFILSNRPHPQIRQVK